MPKLTPPFNMKLTDSHSRGDWFFQLKGQPLAHFLTQDQFSVVLNAEGRKVGDFDEQRTWEGGRGGERFSDDPTKYKDAKEATTWVPGHLFPSLQWQISSGYRDAEFTLLGSKSWRGVFGTKRYRSRTITASASSNRLNAWIWLRRIGTPGTLTVELQSSSGGTPTGTVLKTATVTTSTITDYISVLQQFTWTAQAVTSGTVYHLVVYGASTDDDKNHWEVAGDATGTAGFYKSAQFASDGTVDDFSMYYRLTDADTTRRWWFFKQGSNWCKVSNETTAALYKWNESTDVWEVIASGTHGLGRVTGRPVEVNGFVYFPQGDSVAIRTWDGTNWDAQTVASGQGCATGLAVGFNAADNTTVIWRYNNALVSGGTTTGLKVSVSRAPAVAAYTTDLAFKNSILINETTQAITNIYAANNTLYVHKANSFGSVDNDRYTEIDFGVRDTPSSDNGIASALWNGFYFFTWLFSTLRLYSGTIDDVGQGFKSNSFPYGREGIDSAYRRYGAHLFVAKDAGTSGTSSVMLYDGLNWHEFARSWVSGYRIRDVAIQTVSGDRNRLWFDCGGDSAFVELPYNKANALYDTGAKYMHEFVLTSSEIDMGTASKLAKYIKEMTATTQNLNGNGIYIDFEYQLDENIGTSNWIMKGDSFNVSPEDSVKVREGNLHKFAYRLRGHTDNQLVPPDVRGIVPTGFSRSPSNRMLDCSASIKDFTVNGKVQSAKKTLEWLEEASQGAYEIHITSDFDQLNDFDCIIAPFTDSPIRSEPQSDNVQFSLLVL